MTGNDRALLALTLTRHDDDTATAYAAAVADTMIAHFHHPDTVCLSCCTGPCDQPGVYPTDTVGNASPYCAICGQLVCTAEQTAAANAWDQKHH